MDVKEFIQYLLYTKVFSADVIKESKKVDYPQISLIVNLLKKENKITQKLLNRLNLKDIVFSFNELVSIFNKQKNKDLRIQGLKFLDELVAATKADFKFQEKLLLENDPNEAIILGIDLGTTNTVASFVRQNEVHIIPFQNGKRLLPSVISINKRNKFDAGFVADNQRNINPEETFFSVKRFIGRRSKDLTNDFVKNYPFKIDLSGEKVKIFSKKLNKKFDCEEISAQILKKVKLDSEAYAGKEIKRCVISVPAYFDHNQVLATKRAAQIAGFENIERLIKEPTAAAFAYEIDKKNNSIHSNTLVCDLGGGTFDISLVKKIGLNMDSLSVIATKGDSDLGGDDYSNLLFDFVKNLILKENDKCIIDPRISASIREQALNAKILLSVEDEVDISIPFIQTSDKKNIDFEYTITRKLFNEIASPLTKRIEIKLKEFLDDKKVKNQKISKVLAVGGSSRMPIFLELIEKITGIKPNIDLNPDEIVAKGAALYASRCLTPNASTLVVDVNPLSLGTGIFEDGVSGLNDVLIPANAPLPIRKVENYTTLKDNQKSILVEVCQGERKLSKDNILLGDFSLDNIEEAPAGVPTLEIMFEINMDGILIVKAKDLVTKSEQCLKISNSLEIEEEDILKLKEIADKMSEIDDSKINLIQTFYKLSIWKKVFDDIDQPVLTSGDEFILESVDSVLASQKSSLEVVNTLIRKLRIIIQEQEAFRISNEEELVVA